MKSYKKILYTLALGSIQCLSVYAQSNGTNSSYSRYGLGLLKDQAQSFNKAMSGLGIGLHAGDKVNMLNPASYAYADSLTFIFDVGISLQNGNFKNENSSINAHNTNLDYINALFRVRKNLGFSFGFVPYSSIGYNYTTSQRVGTDYITGNTITSATNYYGDGGIHQFYMGIGWQPFRNFSIGTNIGYLWGKYSHSISQKLYNGTSLDANASNLSRQFSSDIASYKIDFGIQYKINVNKENQIILGAIAGIGHKLNNDATLLNFTSKGDSSSYIAENAFEIPYSFGVGLSWNHKNRWTVGADVHHERWAGCIMPDIRNHSGNNIEYKTISDNYLNRTKAVLGLQFVPNYTSKNYFQRVEYKFGVSYATPYVKVNNANGPREYGITAGFGLPVSNKKNNRSIINVSFQWLHVHPSQSNMITENYLRLNLGITFNESWFIKWKIN